jgi:PhnB protein
MARTNLYLNFPGTTEAAFSFYRSVFGTEYAAPVARMRDVPLAPGQPPIADEDKDLVMHVALPILGGLVLMGTDAVESMGRKLTIGNNFSITLEPDTRAEADRLFEALSAGGQVEMPMQDMFWGAYWGSLTDRFGVQWMVNCTEKRA